MMRNIIAAALLALAPLCAFAADTQNKAENSERKIAVQMFSVRHIPFEEAIETLANMGVKYIQPFPNQKLRKNGEATFSPKTMSAEDKAFVKALLAKHGVKIVDFGVNNARSDEDIKGYFEFAKEFEIPSITTEVAPGRLAVYNKYAKEYKIPVNVHNHEVKPKKESYGDPKNVIKAIKDLEWVYAEPDNGHWTRSGLDSIECLKILKGKIGNVHFKDMTKFGDLKATSCPYGEGVVDLKAILAELDAQGFNGYLIMEFDGVQTDPVGSIKKSLEYFNKNLQKK